MKIVGVIINQSEHLESPATMKQTRQKQTENNNPIHFFLSLKLKLKKPNQFTNCMDILNNLFK